MTAPVGPDIVDERAPLYLDAPEPLTIGRNARALLLRAISARGAARVVPEEHPGVAQ